MSRASSLLSLPDAHAVYVPKNFFFDGMSLPVDLFIRMRPDSYLLIGRQGEKAQFADLHGFNHPSFKIYVRKEDHERLISSVTDMTNKLVLKPEVSTKIKSQFLAGLITDVTASLEEKQVTTGEQIRRVSGLFLELKKTSPLFEEALKILTDAPEESAKHVMITCLTSLAIAEEMQITQAQVLEKLTLGALLHDIGMKYVPAEILQKPRHSWTIAELQAFEQHPLHGAEMLRDIKDIPMDVLMIVAEHHENAQGTGFPKKLRDVRISPLARIVSLAAYFTELLYLNSDKSNADAAIEYIENVAGQPFNRQVFSALKNIVNKRHMTEKFAQKKAG